MSKRRAVPRLGLKFLSVSALALALAFCVYLLLYELALPWFLYDDQFRPYWQRREADAAQSFQAYAAEQGLTLQAALRDKGWARGHPAISLYLEEFDPVLYDSWEDYAPQDYGGFPIICADGTLYAYASPSDLHYYGLGRAAALAAAMVCFLLVVLPYIYRIINRIARLSRDMEILAGGDLSCEVVSPGRDELAELGRGMDEMRRSVLEQIKRENEAVLANSQLITSLSHDLRTPLTKLMGYLDILRYDKCGEDQRAVYLRRAADKALQMRALSDEMFRHFKVEGEASGQAQASAVSGPALLGQILGEQCCDLEAQGFQVGFPVLEGDYDLLVWPEEVLRVFDNLFSNLKKYADPAYPVTVTAEDVGDAVHIRLENRVRPAPAADSRGIGLPTIRALLERNHARLEVREELGAYHTEVVFEKQAR